MIIESGTITGMVLVAVLQKNGYTEGNKVTVTEGNQVSIRFMAEIVKISNNNIVTINGGTFTNTNTMTDGIYGGYSAQTLMIM